MPFVVLLHPKAVKALRSMAPEDSRRAKRALRMLGEDPFTPRAGADIRKLRGTGGRQDLNRLRIGRFRAVCGVDEREVRVTDLFERGEGYDL